MKKSEIIKRLSAIEKHLGIHKEQPVDKFADLKEAHKNRAVIQLNSIYNDWHDVEDEADLWLPTYEYRIKPEEKPKVGDVFFVKIKSDKDIDNLLKFESYDSV